MTVGSARGAMMILTLMAVGCQGIIASTGEDPEAGPVAGGGPPDPSQCSPPPARLWRLTAAQLQRTVEELAPGIGDIASNLSDGEEGRFSNNSASFQMSTVHVEQLLNISGRVADYLLEPGSSLAGCAESDAASDCLSNFVGEFGERAFRRPLSDEERSRYVAFFEAEQAHLSRRSSAHQLVRAFLMSPSFLYRSEIGAGEPVRAGVVALTSDERASAISYLITNGPPDSALREAARRNELATPEQMSAHARRLVASAASAGGVERFFEEHLDPGGVVGAAKEPELFPDYSEEISFEMAEETRGFVRHVLFQDDARLQTLLTAPYTVASPALAAFYGLPSPDPSTQLVSLEGEQRSGLLGQGSFLARYSTAEESDIIHRGLFVREHILCGAVPPPPLDLLDDFPTRPEGMGQREFVEELHVSEDCAVCHELMDPFGFALEHFDAVGRYRDTEGPHAIDASGYMVGVEASGEFDGLVELAESLSDLPETSACFVRRFYEYSSGAEIGSAHACALHELENEFEASDHNMLEMFVALVARPDFAERSPMEDSE